MLEMKREGFEVLKVEKARAKAQSLMYSTDGDNKDKDAQEVLIYSPRGRDSEKEKCFWTAFS